MVKRNVIMIEIYRIHLRDSSNKLEDAFTAPKTYWTLLNHLLYKKKITVVLPLLVDGNAVSHFNKKANLFNNFFAFICTTIKNAHTLSYFSYKQQNEFFPCY